MEEVSSANEAASNNSNVNHFFCFYNSILTNLLIFAEEHSPNLRHTNEPSFKFQVPGFRAALLRVSGFMFKVPGRHRPLETWNLDPGT